MSSLQTIQPTTILPTDIRFSELKHRLYSGVFTRVMEAHNGLSGIIADRLSSIDREGKTKKFDAIWVSSLCDSISKGKPDIEVVDFSSRFQTINEIMDVTTKPLIIDGDTGGTAEHFSFMVHSLERTGVSAVIIEDKRGLKRNSLATNDNDVSLHEQEDPEVFSQKIRTGKEACATDSFMVIGRIESLIMGKGMDDAVSRAKTYIRNGVDGIMIHSKKDTPFEIFDFCKKLRGFTRYIPIVTVPTTYNKTTEEELQEYGVSMVIYANQLLRSSYLAMKKTAEKILEYGNSYESEKEHPIAPIAEILDLIPSIVKVKK